ncbi:hypothetical protein Mapa_004882 [Marchantia paleacea]|nr:hypothetical protein Mapa_004882 [Marchantia paleacea]
MVCQFDLVVLDYFVLVLFGVCMSRVLKRCINSHIRRSLTVNTLFPWERIVILYKCQNLCVTRLLHKE